MSKYQSRRVTSLLAVGVSNNIIGDTDYSRRACSLQLVPHSVVGLERGIIVFSQARRFP